MSLLETSVRSTKAKIFVEFMKEIHLQQNIWNWLLVNDMLISVSELTWKCFGLLLIQGFIHLLMIDNSLKLMRLSVFHELKNMEN